MIASNSHRACYSLFRNTPALKKSETSNKKRDQAAGFYWTAGTHSINYSHGYAPTVKIGSSLNIPSPPAVHYGNVVRLLTPVEALRLQGFEDDFSGFSKGQLYKMAGNAVPKPMGLWVFEGVEKNLEPETQPTVEFEQMSLLDTPEKSWLFRKAGFSTDGDFKNLLVPSKGERATNLIDFIDQKETSRLSQKASAGLLNRLNRSNQVCPDSLRLILNQYAKLTGVET
jgi:hypothetical protein